ncbi:MAG: YncE family protein [Bacteroidia bacterium]
MVAKSLNRFIVAAALFGMVLISSCGTDEPTDNGNIDLKEGLLVLNEGGFQKGNSSLAFIELDSGNVRTNLYQSANNKALGDVGQSFSMINNLLYVVVNNSQQIKVLDATDFTEKNVIEGFTSPRQILPVSNNRAYVSDLFGNAVSVVDLNTNMITNKIKLKGYTEKMAITGNNAYITNNATHYVYVVDVQSDAIFDSVEVGGKNDEVHMLNTNVVVVRNADLENDIKAAFVTISPSTNTVISTVEFNATATVWDAKTVLYQNEIYAVHEGKVIKFNGNEVIELFSVTGVSVSNGIYVNDDHIYITDARDYSSTGAVVEFDMSGNLLNSYETGIIPSNLMFMQL